MRDQIVGQFLGEAIREAWHIKDKWKKLCKQYFKKTKIHNVLGDNEGLKWIWYDKMNAMLSEITKANGVSVAIDQRAPMPETYVALVKVEDDGFDEDVPPAIAVRAANLPVD